MFGKKYFAGIAKIWIAVGVVLCLVAVVAGSSLKNYLDRPQMVVNENGDCISAEGPNGIIDCKGIAKKDYGRFDIIVAYSPTPK